MNLAKLLFLVDEANDLMKGLERERDEARAGWEALRP
jgi:hypothetical protein